jgi:hypothetical protein
MATRVGDVLGVFLLRLAAFHFLSREGEAHARRGDKYEEPFHRRFREIVGYS